MGVGEDVNWSKYTECYNDHKDIASTNPSNPRFVNFLDRDMELFDEIGDIAWSPSITINNEIYRGDLTNANYLFKALCSIMLTKLDACSQISISNDYMLVNNTQQNAQIADLT